MDILYESGGATAVQIRERMADPPTDSAVRSIPVEMSVKVTLAPGITAPD